MARLRSPGIRRSNSLDGVKTGNWIEYKGKQRADGVVETESVKLGPNFVSDDEKKLREKQDFDPSSTPGDAKQSMIKTAFGYTDPRRIPLFKNPAMQERISEIGEQTYSCLSARAARC